MLSGVARRVPGRILPRSVRFDGVHGRDVRERPCARLPRMESDRTSALPSALPRLAQGATLASCWSSLMRAAQVAVSAQKNASPRGKHSRRAASLDHLLHTDPRMHPTRSDVWTPAIPHTDRNPHPAGDVRSHCKGMSHEQAQVAVRLRHLGLPQQSHGQQSRQRCTIHYRQGTRTKREVLYMHSVESSPSESERRVRSATWPLAAASSCACLPRRWSGPAEPSATRVTHRRPEHCVAVPPTHGSTCCSRTDHPMPHLSWNLASLPVRNTAPATRRPTSSSNANTHSDSPVLHLALFCTLQHRCPYPNCSKASNARVSVRKWRKVGTSLKSNA